jgi:hypothetical protein
MPQLEQGAFATSVIPTTGTAATRTADVVSITGTNFSSWYRQDEGTVFADFAVGYSSNFPNFPNVYDFNSGASTDRVSLFGNQGARSFTPAIRSGNVAQLDFVAFTVAAQSRSAHAFALNSSQLAANGSLTGATDTSVTMPTGINRIDIGIGFGQQFTGTIRRLTYWPQRLPNNVLQSITQ